MPDIAQSDWLRGISDRTDNMTPSVKVVKHIKTIADSSGPHRSRAAPKIPTTAPNSSPRAIRIEPGAAAEGAGGAEVESAAALRDAVVDADETRLEAEEPAELVAEAVVLTETFGVVDGVAEPEVDPETLLAVLDAAVDDADEDVDEDEEKSDEPLKVTTMRISSHWAPMDRSYRL